MSSRSSFVSAAIRTGSGWCESLLYVSFCDACNLVVGAFEQCCLSVVVIVKFSLLSVRSSLFLSLNKHHWFSDVRCISLHTEFSSSVSFTSSLHITCLFVLFFDDIDAIVCFVCCVRFHAYYSLVICVFFFICIAQARLLRSPVSLSLLDPFLIV